MAKVKGQMVPPELRDKYNRVLQTNTDNIVSTRQQRSPQSTERQREHQENFIRCTLYWDNLSEEQKADIYNLAQNEGMRYYNYFMNEVLKKRHQGALPEYALKIESFPVLYSSLEGITTIDDSIIVADSPENRLYQLNENLELIRTIEIPGITPKGLTTLNNYLWITDGSENIYQIDLEGNIINQFYLQERHLQAITADKTQLICYDSLNSEVISFCPASAHSETIYKANDIDIQGLGWDGVYLWASTSQAIIENNLDFSIEEYLPGEENINFKLKQVNQQYFSLKRFAGKNSNSLFDLYINLNIPLFYFCIKNNLVWATDKENNSIHRIRVVADLP
jgi:hypothetical protein